MKHKEQAISRSARTGQFVVPRREEKTIRRGETYERAKVIAKSIDGALKRLASK